MEYEYNFKTLTLEGGTLQPETKSVLYNGLIGTTINGMAADGWIYQHTIQAGSVTYRKEELNRPDTIYVTAEDVVLVFRREKKSV